MQNSARILAIATTFAALAGCGGGIAPVSPNAPGRATAPRAATAWIPAARTSFAIQYGGRKLDTSVAADVYDVDGFDTSAATVSALHGDGRHVVCYIDVGTWERWRPDAGTFPKGLLGNPDGGWPGERWLDVRQASLRPIMSKRFAMCKSKGFDAVDPDNIDGYSNRPGFPITPAEQIAYDTWVAGAVHALGLSVAQKNDGDQIGALRSAFDFAVLEGCYRGRWCNVFNTYSNDDRLVVDIEYKISESTFTSKVCPVAAAGHDTALLKHLSLDAWVRTCPAVDPPARR